MKRYPQSFDERFPQPRHRGVWPPAPYREEPAPEPAPQTAPEPAPQTPQTAPAALRDATERLDAARARVERDAARVLEETRGKLVEQLLPVLDSLDRSIAAGGDSGNKLIRAQLEGVLSKFGLERFDAEVGAPFDPHQHEAMAVAEVERARAGTVVAQWDAGYRHGGRLLRPARVQVGRHRS